jgi:hypothetical protein
MQAPGDVLASGCRMDVVRLAKDSGKPVSCWSRLMGRVLLLMVEADDIVTTMSGFWVRVLRRPGIASVPFARVSLKKPGSVSKVVD